jgi:hypothetical protein
LAAYEARAVDASFLSFGREMLVDVARRGARDADKLATEIVMEWGKCLVDVPCQGGEVGIDGAHNNPRVIGPLPMQGNEVTPIESDNRPRVRCREGEDLRVCHLDAGAPSFGDSHHIVSEAAEFQYGGKREVLVGVEPSHGHQASSLALA